MSILRLLVVTCLFAASAAFGHQDRIIRLNDGKLNGLPPQYKPAFFSSSERRIEVGELATVMPECIWKHFAKAKEAEFRFLASWYHDPRILPPYIQISVPEEGTKNRFKLLLNLDTLAPISLEKVVQVSDSSWSHQKIPLEKSCLSRWSVAKTK